MPTLRLLASATVLLVAGFLACSLPVATPAVGTIPDFMRGDFVDDYGIQYSVSDSAWSQGHESRYQIVRWDPAGRYLVARNDANNPTEPGLWTRIDWVELDSVGFAWAFCYAVYDAPDLSGALAAPSSDRATPRSGCGGFPFSRMRSLEAPPPSRGAGAQPR